MKSAAERVPIPANVCNRGVRRCLLARNFTKKRAAAHTVTGTNVHPKKLWLSSIDVNEKSNVPIKSVAGGILLSLVCPSKRA